MRRNNFLETLSGNELQFPYSIRATTSCTPVVCLYNLHFRAKVMGQDEYHMCQIVVTTPW